MSLTYILTKLQVLEIQRERHTHRGIYPLLSLLFLASPKAANAKRMAFKRALDRLSPSQFGAGEAGGTELIWKLK